jgi:hypothetical protein
MGLISSSSETRQVHRSNTIHKGSTDDWLDPKLGCSSKRNLANCLHNFRSGLAKNARMHMLCKLL